MDYHLKRLKCKGKILIPPLDSSDRLKSTTIRCKLIRWWEWIITIKSQLKLTILFFSLKKTKYLRRIKNNSIKIIIILGIN